MENNQMSMVLSNRLKDILYNIDDDISKTLLTLEGNDDFIYNFSFIDITDDDGTLSFLPVNKYKNMEIKKGNSDIIWSSPVRNDIRLGRLINKLTPFYNASNVENFVNMYKAEFRDKIKNIKFKIIDGKDIVKYYNAKYYTIGNGSLNKSCMRHDQCGKYMDLYVKNKDNIKMVVLMNNHETIEGRALLWKLNEPADSWLLDRIYVKDDSDVILFKKYAEKNGWFYKTLQTFDCEEVTFNKKSSFIPMKINIKGSYTYFPYIDTLLYYNVKDNYLTNNKLDYSNNSNVIKLREINGKNSGNENYVYDNIDKIYLNINDSVYCYYGDTYTHVNNAYFSKELQEYIHPSELRYSTYQKRFLFKNNSVYSYILNSFINSNDVIKVYLDRTCKEFDYLLKKDYEKTFNICEGNYYISDVLIKGNDNKFYFDKKHEIEVQNKKNEKTTSGLPKLKQIKSFIVP